MGDEDVRAATRYAQRVVPVSEDSESKLLQALLLKKGGGGQKKVVLIRGARKQPVDDTETTSRRLC